MNDKIKNVFKESQSDFYDTEYCLLLEYRVFSGAHGSRIRNILKAVGDVKGLEVLDVGAGGGRSRSWFESVELMFLL